MAEVVGTVRAGSGTAARKFADADFETFGYLPFPGTLNLRVGEAEKVMMRAGRLVDGPVVNSHTRYLPCTVGGVPAHVHFAGGPKDVEVFAPVRLRDLFADGDTVTITFEDGAA